MSTQMKTGRWTQEDLQYLTDNHKTSSISELSYSIGRTTASVANRLRKHLGVYKRGRQGERNLDSKYGYWTQKQVDFLLVNYGKMLIKDIASELDKAIGSIYRILEHEGVDRDVRSPYWNDEEIIVLKNRYQNTANTDLAKLFNRTVDAVQLKSAELGLSKDSFWSKADLNLLKDMLADGSTYKEMGARLNRNQSSIAYKMQIENLSGDIERWSKEKLKKIKKMALSNGAYTYIDIAKETGEPINRIVNICTTKGWNEHINKSMSVGATHMTELIKEAFPNYTLKKEYAVGDRLRLDVYLPELNIGFEYDGEQHFKFTPHWHKTYDKFIEAQDRDARKNELCRLRGINLVRVKHDETLTKELLQEKIDFVGLGTGEIIDDSVLTFKEKKKKNKFRMTTEQKELAKKARKESYQRQKEYFKKAAQ